MNLSLIPNLKWMLLAGVLGLTTSVTSCAMVKQFGDLKSERSDRKAAETERDRLLGWADNVCALVDNPFRAEKKREQWGTACAAGLRGLVAFKADVNAAATTIVTNNQATQASKAARDAGTVRKQRVADQAAAKRMEAADAAVQEDNRVDGDWFGALNELGGLRPRL